MNASGEKGSAWETACAVELIKNGWVQAEPRRMGGANDRGDLAGLPGVVFECKNEKRMDLPGYLRELDVEIANAKAEVGFAWLHRMGKASARDGYLVTTVPIGLRLLKLAGW